MYQQNKYTPESIRKMQIEAAKRVKNMQAMAQKTLEESMSIKSKRANLNSPNLSSDTATSNPAQQPKSNTKSSNNNYIAPSNSIENIINTLFEDTEKSLLLVLLLLLVRDNAESHIIFALIYILM